MENGESGRRSQFDVNMPTYISRKQRWGGAELRGFYLRRQ